MNNPLADPLQSRLRDARELARNGRGVEAARLWMSALEIDPGNVEALLALGQMSLSRGDPAAALPVLQRAAAPGTHPMAELCLALAHKELGDRAAEAAAVRRSLAIDPYFYPALLHEAPSSRTRSGSSDISRRPWPRCAGRTPAPGSSASNAASRS